MVKICQTGLLKLNFEIIPKKSIFRFLPKISAGHGWSWKNVFASFQILGPLGCQGWVFIPQNVKKVKITAPEKTILSRWTNQKGQLKSGKWKGRIISFFFYTDEKLLLYKEIQAGSVAESYMTNGLLIYNFAVCTRSYLNFLIYCMRIIFCSFLSA